MKTIKNLKVNTPKTISKLESLGVEIEFTAENEDTSPFDMLEESDSAQRVCEDFDSGNEAAWFSAKVTLRYKGIEADDYLGCCSYRSFKEFTTARKDYYLDMINQCINQINKEVESNNWHTQKSWNVRKAKQLIAPYNLHIVSSLSVHEL